MIYYIYKSYIIQLFFICLCKRIIYFKNCFRFINNRILISYIKIFGASYKYIYIYKLFVFLIDYEMMQFNFNFNYFYIL